MQYSPVDINAMKEAAGARWTEILGFVTGIDMQLLDGKNHPCPKCGGKDRFRMIDEERGALFCNQCFNKGNGDGIAAIMWLTGLQFPEAVQRIAEHLGIKAEEKDRDLVAEMAWRKGTSADVLRQFGAHIASRGDLQVCRIPMYDADMKKVGDFDISPISPEFEKGKMTKGSRHGMFVAEEPKPGDVVAIVEGVKDASALVAIGIKAVGLPTCRMDAAFARFFRDCHVVIVPDRDKAGVEGAAETAARLYKIAASIKVAELPTEFKESGGADVRDVIRMSDGIAKVNDCIEHAKDYELPNSSTLVQTRELRFISLSQSIDQLLEQEDQEQNFLKTGLPGIDAALAGGVLPGEMIIIAGRPSHGKTVVGMQALDNLSKTVPVLMLSEEMSVQALARRTLCSISHIPTNEWSQRKCELAMAKDSHFGHRQPYLIVESCGTIERAVAAITKAKEDFNIGAVAVDYVQMIKGKGGSRYEQVSDASTMLKQAAVANSVVLLAVCQLNREVEKRNTTLPRMSDLRDSGQLEQDSDVIMFVEWLYRTSPEAHTKNEYRILVAKNRNRPIVNGLVECTFVPERQRLYGKDWQNCDDAFDAQAASEQACGMENYESTFE